MQLGYQNLLEPSTLPSRTETTSHVLGVAVAVAVCRVRFISTVLQLLQGESHSLQTTVLRPRLEQRWPPAWLVFQPFVSSKRKKKVQVNRHLSLLQSRDSTKAPRTPRLEQHTRMLNAFKTMQMAKKLTDICVFPLKILLFPNKINFIFIHEECISALSSCK